MKQVSVRALQTASSNRECAMYVSCWLTAGTSGHRARRSADELAWVLVGQLPAELLPGRSISACTTSSPAGTILLLGADSSAHPGHRAMLAALQIAHAIIQAPTAGQGTLHVVTLLMQSPVTALMAPGAHAKAAHGCVSGFIRCLDREHPRLHPRLIDIDVVRVENIVESLARELDSSRLVFEAEVVISRPVFVCRLMQGWSLHLTRDPQHPSKSRHVCVVAGGLGGLGLNFTPWLLDVQNFPQVVITSRSGKVARDGQGLGDRLSAIMAQYGAARVAVRVNDSSSMAETRALLQVLQGAPSWLHMPHVLRDRLIRSALPDDIPYVLSAKAVGAWNAHAVTAKLDMEYCVLFSSLASFGGVGIAMHSSANAYLDALAIAETAAALPCLSLVVPLVSGEGAGASMNAGRIAAGDTTTLAMTLAADEIIMALDSLLSGQQCAAPVQGPLFKSIRVLDALSSMPKTLVDTLHRHYLQDGKLHPAFRAKTIAERHAQHAAAMLALDSAVCNLHDPPQCCDVAIVGAGLAGLAVACELTKEGIGGFAIFEKSASVGGVWRWQGNPLSRVNSSEPGYRLAITRRHSTNHNTNHSYSYEILDDCRTALEEHRLGEHLFLNAGVRVVCPAIQPDSWTLQGTRLSAIEFRCVVKQTVVLCLNRRLGVPRYVAYPGEENFGGWIRRGLAGDVADVQWAGREVVVVGMGAFAVEQTRTALECGAARVELLVRRHGLVCPQIIDYLNFVRPFTARLEHLTSGSTAMVHFWRTAYKSSGASQPESWQDGWFRPDGHTVSVSDMWFVGHFLDVISTSVDTISSFTHDGLRTSRGTLLAAQVCIKSIGFEIQATNEQILGRNGMRANGMVQKNLWAVFEQHLDVESNNLPFASYVNATNFSAKVIAQSWKDFAFYDELQRLPLPIKQMNKLTAAEQGQALTVMVGNVSKFAEMISEHMETVQADFAASWSPQSYLAFNRQQWGEIHQQLHATARTPQEQSLGYVCDDILEVLEREAPELLHDAASSWSINAVQPGTSSVQQGDQLTTPHPVPDVSLTPLEKQRSVDAVTLRTVASCVSVDITLDTPLMDAGLDSISATEVAAKLQAATGASVSPMLVFDHPTPRSIAKHLLAQVGTAIPQDWTLVGQGLEPPACEVGTVAMIPSPTLHASQAGSQGVISETYLGDFASQQSCSHEQPPAKRAAIIFDGMGQAPQRALKWYLDQALDDVFATELWDELVKSLRQFGTVTTGCWDLSRPLEWDAAHPAVSGSIAIMRHMLIIRAMLQSNTFVHLLHDGLVAVAGHSIGNITAAVVSHGITASREAGLTWNEHDLKVKAKLAIRALVKLGSALETNYPACVFKQTLCAFTPLRTSLDDIEQLLAADDGVHVAVINSQSSVLLSGSDAACRRCISSKFDSQVAVAPFRWPIHYSKTRIDHFQSDPDFQQLLPVKSTLFCMQGEAKEGDDFVTTVARLSVTDPVLWPLVLQRVNSALPEEIYFAGDMVSEASSQFPWSACQLYRLDISHLEISTTLLPVHNITENITSRLLPYLQGPKSRWEESAIQGLVSGQPEHAVFHDDESSSEDEAELYTEVPSWAHSLPLWAIHRVRDLL